MLREGSQRCRLCTTCYTASDDGALSLLCSVPTLSKLPFPYWGTFRDVFFHGQTLGNGAVRTIKGCRSLGSLWQMTRTPPSR